jgi:UDP-GlcNAc:undecaprenyl-phosphate/decaprenyl-phosphate GlcNAc-1-phosphate transferase
MKIAILITSISAISIILTWITRAGARALGVIAAPRKDRWHSRPTALMGGVAIYGSFICGILIFHPDISSIKRLLLAGTLLFIVGLIDDLLQIKPYIKLAAQLVASSALVFSGLVLPWTQIPVIDITITFIWLVGITNAVNMLDNMDGLAGGISLIACLCLALNFVLNDQFPQVYLPLILAAAIAGFLVFNFNPASIFMGDCGSMLIGFTIAGMALFSNEQRTRNLSAVLATPALIMLLPIFDTTIVTISRKLNGRPVSQGGRDHTSHRLVALGMSDRRAVLILYLISLISGGLALLVRDLDIGVGVAIVAAFAVTIVLLGFYLGKVGVYDESEAPVGAWIRDITGHPYRKRLFEVLLDFTLITLVYYVSYLLRFDGQLPAAQLAIFLRTLPYVIALHLFAFLFFGVYRGLWQYAGIEELVGIGKSVVAASTISGILVLTWYGFQGPSRSVFIINSALLTLVMGACRISFRLLAVLIVGQRPHQPGGRLIIIYGAGGSGEIILRELLQNPDHQFEPVAFIDDDPDKAGKSLRGYPIHASTDLPALLSQYAVSDVIVSTAKVDDAHLEKFQHLGVRFRRLRIAFE